MRDDADNVLGVNILDEVSVVPDIGDGDFVAGVIAEENELAASVTDEFAVA